MRIIRDCARDDDLDRSYSLPALRRALRVLPDDLRDYTGCERAIRRAIRKAENRRLRVVVERIRRDCTRDGDLDRVYALPALRLALRRLSDDRGCGRALRRAIHEELRSQRRESRQIIRDCARDGRLDRRYSLMPLRRALRLLPDDIRDYTNCEQVIHRAIRRTRKNRPESQRGHATVTTTESSGRRPRSAS